MPAWRFVTALKPPFPRRLAGLSSPANAIQGISMRKDFERAHVTAHDNIAVLTLNHLEVMNAASVKMIRGLYAALDHIAKPRPSPVITTTRKPLSGFSM